ncbi:ExeM/NucH family extracellular endonuclease [Nocardioides sp. KR10-350]|uniref:ExeM/NucH family extracellular endonuclease n=1 Tax=Nocardioides cheoyonin TaxID=3156615 RepID=UPI0032B61426
MSSARRRIAVSAALALTVAGLTGYLAPAHANPDGTGLVISEVYGAGGNSGAVYDADFVELYNPTDAAISLNGLAIHYRSAGGGSGGTPYALAGTVPAHGHWLVQMSKSGTNGTALPTPDQTASPAFSMAAAGGQVALQEGTSIIATSGDVTGTDGLVDFFGGSGAASYEGAAATKAATATQSLNRTADGADTDDNAADFTLAAPSPTDSGSGGGGEPPTPENEPIADIQGSGDTSPMVGDTVTTEGVVTAYYGTGGFNGLYIEDPSGSPTDGRSDAIFVYGSAATSAGVKVGDSVSVTGKVSEYQGTTELTPSSGGVTELDSPLGDVAPLQVPWSDLDTDAEKQAHEGEVVVPSGDFTVSDNYDANYYGSFVLAHGDHPLVTPTEVADAQDSDAIAAVEADNAAREITLDDGRSTNFNSSKGTPFTWLTSDNPVRIGSAVSFHEPVVLEYRYDAWNFQPTTPLADGDDGHDVATFSDTRADNAKPRDVGGDLRLATFNVLNYFPTTGEEYVDSGLGTCTYYDDRAGNHISDNVCEGPNGEPGPRGAATEESLKRQQVKIVKAINSLGASIVSLEELENSAWFGKDRDYAIGKLVAALNADAGAGTWAYAPSPDAANLPPLEQQDVIRTGFIYKPADVTPIGRSYVLTGQSGDGGAFQDAREPLAQAFKPIGHPRADAFLVIVNHFKSKGSGEDDGTGQGLANPARIAQAKALKKFATTVEAKDKTDRVFLTGDFNAYSEEDPVQVLESDTVDGAASEPFHELNGELNGGEATYSFDGMDGSLDHVFANAAAKSWVTGVDVWQINAQEQVGFEYSRYNYNATILYQGDNVFRASDHNPEIVGIDLPARASD